MGRRPERGRLAGLDHRPIVIESTVAPPQLARYRQWISRSQGGLKDAVDENVDSFMITIQNILFIASKGVAFSTSNALKLWPVGYFLSFPRSVVRDRELRSLIMHDRLPAHISPLTEDAACFSSSGHNNLWSRGTPKELLATGPLRRELPRPCHLTDEFAYGSGRGKPRD
jgi:hypothetical protein